MDNMNNDSILNQTGTRQDLSVRRQTLGVKMMNSYSRYNFLSNRAFSKKQSQLNRLYMNNSERKIGISTSSRVDHSHVNAVKSKSKKRLLDAKIIRRLTLNTLKQKTMSTHSQYSKAGYSSIHQSKTRKEYVKDSDRITQKTVMKLKQNSQRKDEYSARRLTHLDINISERGEDVGSR